MPKNGSNVFQNNNNQFNVTCFFLFNLMLEISNLASNLCQSAVASTDRPPPVICPPSSTPSPAASSLTPLTHSPSLHLSPSLSVSSSLSLSQIQLFPSFPCFLSKVSACILVLSVAPLPDVRGAGLAVCWPQPPGSRRRSVRQMSACIFIQGL